jgi:spore germination cell wall hydrolase CwlJ-like protein
MLFPTDSTHWLHRAVERLQTEADPEAQKSLLFLLWYAQTSESDAAVAAFAKAADKPAATRDIAREFAGGNSKLLAMKNGSETARKPATIRQSEASIRKARVKTMSRISDEALIEFDEETLKLIAIRKQKAESR